MWYGIEYGMIRRYATYAFIPGRGVVAHCNICIYNLYLNLLCVKKYYTPTSPSPTSHNCTCPFQYFMRFSDWSVEMMSSVLIAVMMLGYVYGVDTA